MKTPIKCQHCGKDSEVEGMGCFRCPHCRKFFISMSEYIRQQINDPTGRTQEEKE